MKKLDIRELQAELKQAEFDIARKARTIIALNESYKALRDGLEPKLADITGKRNAAESRATEAERQLKQAQEASEDGVAHWTAKCNEIETLLSEKLTAAESRAEQAELSEESMYEKVRSLAPHGTCACSYDKPGDLCMHHSPQLVKAEARAEQWERKFNDDGPRCKVRTDSKEGRFIAPTDCGKEDLEQRVAAAESRAERFSSSLDNVRNEAKKNARRAEQAEQRLARVKEIVAIGVNALEHCDHRHKKCNCSKEALAEIAAVLKETEEK